MDLKILVATHKEYWMPTDEVYLPIHVGRDGKQDLGYTGDNTGENISIKNANYFELTGLYCVGCGAGRAFLSLLSGNIYAAFCYNPLLIVLLPFMAYYLLKLYISFVFGKDILPFPKISARWFGISLLIIIVAFWILRNIPFAPFSYLAPTSV